jgi:hypothetical protein
VKIRVHKNLKPNNLEMNMKKEILKLIEENNLSPFSKSKTSIKAGEKSIYKTKDAKAVYTKVLSNISDYFTFSETSNLFNCLPFTDDLKVIKERQDFFARINRAMNNDFLKLLTAPKRTWRPKYGIVAVTEDDKTFQELQKIGCAVKFLVNEYDLESMEDYDIIQVIDCENFSQVLERLPQTVFLDSIDDIYLERHLELLSGWKANIEILEKNNSTEEISKLVKELSQLFTLMLDKPLEHIKKEQVEHALDEINDELQNEIKNLTLSGESLFSMLSRNSLPENIQTIIRNSIRKRNLPENIFQIKIPLSIDEEALDKLMKKQSAEENTGVAEKIKKKSKELREIPGKLDELSANLILFDFLSGISQFMQKTTNFPEFSENLSFEDSANLFIDKAQPISFALDEQNKCSILTGANSGGKTTLLEHIIQIISLFQLGLPVSGKASLPIFTDVYYFAKNKGSMNKGAFETLLTQMSIIKPGKQTLILADEIESVTEPGVAGMIISATADYFIKQNSYLVIATHLGKEIQKNLPQLSRIDGIEAKGLDEFYELIVDHNPVLGRIANSTPELIVEKMANSKKEEYFTFLYDYLKKSK